MTQRAMLLALAILGGALAGPAGAQATVDPARLVTAKRMMTAAGADKQFDQAMPLMAEQMSQTFMKIAPEKAKEIADVFRQLVPRFIDRKGELLDEIAKLYAAEMTQDEMKGVIAFYKSPAGAKFAAVQPGIMRQSIVLGQRWGQRIGAEIADEARRELKKRGIDL